LQRYVHELTHAKRSDYCKKILRSIEQFVASVDGYLSDDGTTDLDQRQVIKAKFDLLFKSLTGSVGHIVVQFRETMIAIFAVQLDPKLKGGIQDAKNTSLASIQKWSMPVDKADRKAGGLHFMTYKATVRRDGAYNSASYGEIDMNQSLIDPLYTKISVAWNRIFAHEVNDVILNVQKEFVNRVVDFMMKYRRELLSIEGINDNRIARVEEQLKKNLLEAKLPEFVNELKNFIQERQKDANRIMTPQIREQMEEGYRNAALQTGSGR